MARTSAKRRMSLYEMTALDASMKEMPVAFKFLVTEIFELIRKFSIFFRDSVLVRILVESFSIDDSTAINNALSTNFLKTHHAFSNTYNTQCSLAGTFTAFN